MKTKCEHLPIPTISPLTGAQCVLCRWLYPLGPSNDEPADVQHEMITANAADGDEAWESWEWMEQLQAAFDWDPTRPLREQWPWRGGTREEWELTQRPTQEVPVVDDLTDDEPPVDPATKFGELSQQVTVPVEWPSDPDLDDAIRAVTPHDPTGSTTDTTCPNCAAVVASRLAHWHDGLGCWTCKS